MKLGIFALAIGLALPDAALACSCRLTATADELMEADAVFTGVALSSKPVARRESMTRFRVTEAYKGVRHGQVIRVRHRSGPSPSCGVNFARGGEYTMTSYRRDPGQPGAGELSSSLCSLAAMESPGGMELRKRPR